jgi:AbrB family looped-hinge helix DNA binding protein
VVIVDAMSATKRKPAKSVAKVTGQRSKITAQGQTSVPAEIRKTLGVGAGSTIEWVEESGRVFVRRAGGYTFEDIHKVLFPDGPPAKRVDVKEAIAKYVRERYARD